MNLQKQLSNYFDNCHLQLVKIILILASVKVPKKNLKFAKFNSISKKGLKSFESIPIISESFRIIQLRVQNNCVWKVQFLTLNDTSTVLVKIILDIIIDNITCITDESSAVKFTGWSFWWVIVWMEWSCLESIKTNHFELKMLKYCLLIWLKD